MKDQLQRCLRELKAYQLKFPAANIEIENRENDVLPPWVTKAEINTPLLDAYDTRIHELEESIREYEMQLTAFAEKAEAITSENENLRNIQLEMLRHNAVKGGRSDVGGGMSASELETFRELSEQLEILMEENGHLVEEKDLLMDELNTTQIELQRCREEMDHLSKLLFTSDRELKAATDRATEAESNRDVSESRLSQASVELGRLEQELDLVKEQLMVSENRGSNADKNMAEARQRLQQMERKVVEENYKLAQKTKAAEDRVRELHLVVLQRTQELENVNDLYRKLKREHQSTRQDAEGMLHVLSGMEKQLQEVSAKEEEMLRFSRESKEKLEEALGLKEQALAKEEQSLRHLNHLLDEKKFASIQKQKDIDDAMERARHLSQEQIRSLEADLMQAERLAATYKVEAESIREKNRHVVDQRDREISELKKQIDSFQSTLGSLAQAMNDLKVGRAGDAHRIERLQDKCSELQAQVDKQRSELESQRQQFEERERAKDKELTALKMSSREALREGDSREGSWKRELLSIKAQKEASDTLVAECERRRVEEVGVLGRRVVDLEHKVQEMEHAVLEKEARHRRQLEDEREQCAKTAKAVELLLKDERKVVETLLNTKKELEGLVAKSSLEKDSLHKALQTEKSKAEQLVQALRKSKASAVELAEKLASSFKAREEAAGAASRAIAQFNLERESPLEPGLSDEFGSSHGLMDEHGEEDYDYVTDGVPASSDFPDFE